MQFLWMRLHVTSSAPAGALSPRPTLLEHQQRLPRGTSLGWVRLQQQGTSLRWVNQGHPLDQPNLATDETVGVGRIHVESWAEWYMMMTLPG